MEEKSSFREWLRSGTYDMGEIRKQEEVLQEMAIAGKGVWKPNEDMVEYKSANVVKIKWKLIIKSSNFFSKKLDYI